MMLSTNLQDAFRNTLRYQFFSSPFQWDIIHSFYNFERILNQTFPSIEIDYEHLQRNPPKDSQINLNISIYLQIMKSPLNKICERVTTLWRQFININEQECSKKILRKGMFLRNYFIWKIEASIDEKIELAFCDNENRTCEENFQL